MSATKDYLTQYYDGTRQYYGTYHNHKEICAWGGLILHVLFCGIILQARFSNTLTLVWFEIITLLVLSSAILVSLYIKNQLEMKDKAASYAAGAFFLLSEILQEDESELELKAADYLAIEKKEGKGQATLVLPKILLDKAKEIHESKEHRFYGDRTRNMIYGLLVLSTLSVLAFMNNMPFRAR